MKKELVVSKSNALARSIQTLDITEAKIIEYCLSNIYYKEKVTVEDRYTVNVEAMATHFNMDRSQAYKELKRIAVSIRGKDIRFPEYANSTVTVVTSWISSVYYNDAEAYLAIKFSEDIIPYISGDAIQSNFTTYKLEEVNFKYTFSNRIFNLCKSYAHKHANHRFDTNIKELREFLSIQDHEYPSWGNLKVALNRSIDEINLKTSIHIDMTERKVNGRTYHIGFIMIPKETEDKND